jgi:hypothetical protein
MKFDHAVEIDPSEWTFIETGTKFVYFCIKNSQFHIGYELLKNGIHGMERKYYVYPRDLSLKMNPCITDEELLEMLTFRCFNINK